MNCKDKILSFIVDENELRECGKSINTPVESTFIECLESLTNPNLTNSFINFKINSVLDYLYDSIYTGHWNTVPNSIRQTYAVASFVKV